MGTVNFRFLSFYVTLKIILSRFYPFCKTRMCPAKLRCGRNTIFSSLINLSIKLRKIFYLELKYV